MDNKRLGEAGEATAERFLRQRGYSILYRNWRCPLGEIDIVAQENEFLVFVEIKTRSSSLFGRGCESINIRKQIKLLKLGEAFLKRYGLSGKPCRIDVVSIDMENVKQPKIELIKDAFWK